MAAAETTPQTIADLGRLWRRSVENEQPGVSADEVLNRLERKYRAMVNLLTTAANRARACE
jgi:hypothetical protein